MYLRLGSGNIAATEEIVGIFDLDAVSQSRYTQLYLEHAEQNKEMFLAASPSDLPRSLVVYQRPKPDIHPGHTNKNTKHSQSTHSNSAQTVCLSPLNASTLARRFEGLFLDNLNLI